MSVCFWVELHFLLLDPYKCFRSLYTNNMISVWVLLTKLTFPIFKARKSLSIYSASIFWKNNKMMCILVKKNLCINLEIVKKRYFAKTLRIYYVVGFHIQWYKCNNLTHQTFFERASIVFSLDFQSYLRKNKKNILLNKFLYQLVFADNVILLRIL